MSIKGQSIGYITLFIGYVITGVGIYYLSYAKGEFNCNPYGEYLNDCRNIGTDAAPKFARSRYIPNDSGDKDPDGSVKYILQEDASACEGFRFLRRRRRIRTGIEGNANYGGGIAGIVFGSIFIVVGYAIIFTTKN